MTIDPSQADLRPDFPGYTRAEFRLQSPAIFFQFKLRQGAAATLFALVRKDSKALEQLKTGTLVPMTFYHQDNTIPPVRMQTRIGYIKNAAGTCGAANTVMVGLEITSQGADLSVPHPF